MAPINDNFANAIELVGPIGLITGTTVGATFEVGEPAGGQADFGADGTTTVWFKWTPDRPGRVSFDLLGSLTDPAAPDYVPPGNNLDTVVHVYTGSTLATLHLVAANDDWTRPQLNSITGNRCSHVEFDVVPGTLYYIRVNGYSLADDFGSLILRWANTVEAVVCTVWELDSLTGNPPPESGWESFYPDSAQPFLTDFTQSPQASASLMYRDTATGDLIKVLPYQESVDWSSGGSNSDQPDSAYGPGVPSPFGFGEIDPIDPDGVTVLPSVLSQVAGSDLGTAFTGWFSGSIFCLETDGTMRWLHDNSGSTTIYSETTRPAVTGKSVWVVQGGDDPSYPQGSLLEFDLFTGTILSHVEPVNVASPSIIPKNWDGVLLWSSVFNDRIWFSYNGGPAADHGLYSVDISTGNVTTVVKLVDIAAAAGIASWDGSFLNLGGFAINPSGTEVILTVQYHNGTESYASVLIEVLRSLPTNVLRTYRQTYDLGNRLTMLWDVSYSFDGNFIYAVGDTSYPIIQRFAYGPGNVGGDAPWMHGDWLTHDDWVTDGSQTHFSSSGDLAVWGSILAGIQVTRIVAPSSAPPPPPPPPPPCPAPPNDQVWNAELLSGNSGSVSGTTICATVAPGETHAVGESGTVWYSYTPTSDGTVTFHMTSGALVSPDPSEVWSIRLAADVTAPASISGPLWQDLVFYVTGGNTYFVQVGTVLHKTFSFEWTFVRKPAVVSDGSLMPNGQGTLGCSQHVAYIQDKCNGPRLCELLDITELSYDRRLDDISEAFVVIPISGDMDDPCCSCLADVEPWCHQLTIVRESDGVVWSGPIQKVTYGFNSVRIEAKDKLAWLQVRVNELTLGGNNPNFTKCLTTIAKEIIELAMSEDDSPCLLDCILDMGDGLPLGADRSREDFVGFGGPTAYDDLVVMGNGGVDYTTVNQCIILTGEHLPDTSVGILTDEMILGDVSIVKDGTQLGNRFYVRYTGDDDCAGICVPQGSPICPCPARADGTKECYGLVERHIDGIQMPNLLAAQVTAQIWLDSSRLVPRVVEFGGETKLSPECPWKLNDMIPGQRLDVALSKLCIPIYQGFKIQQVSVTDGAGGESISVTLKTQATS